MVNRIEDEDNKLIIKYQQRSDPKMYVINNCIVIYIYIYIYIKLTLS